ncbi:MAG: hypothetical protein JST59_00940 [Actinobacteria bacterium]|nr:hypothetical protein [Actinomycetota bacterium]
MYSNTLLKRRHAPDVFINTLIFTIPLIVVRVSIKELFLLDYLVRLWTSTGFTPQQFFKKKNISRYRPDHHVIDKEDVPLLELMT